MGVDHSIRLPARGNPRALLLALGLLGLAARLLLAAVSAGSDDIRAWHRFSTIIEERGLLALYLEDPLFNHPPLAGYLGASALFTARYLHLPFAFIFKLPSVVADCLTAFLLFRIWRRKADERMAARVFALYGLTLCSILVTGYHGNTDSICTFLAFLAIFLLEEKRSDFWSGAALAAAINVKLIPLLLIPALLSQYRLRKNCLKFSAGLSVGILPFLPLAMAIGPTLYGNVLQYNSLFEWWGLPVFLKAFEKLSRPVSQPLADWLSLAAEHYRHVGRYLIVFSIVAVCVLGSTRRRLGRYDLATVSISFFLILAPGFGVQYVVYAVPFIFVQSTRWGALYASVAGVYIGLVYYHFLVDYAPLASAHTLPYPRIYAIPATITWGVLVAVLTKTLLPAASQPRNPGAVRWTFVTRATSQRATAPPRQGAEGAVDRSRGASGHHDLTAICYRLSLGH